MTVDKIYEVLMTGNMLQAECSGAYTLRSGKATPERWLTSERERKRLKKMLSVIVLLI